MQRIGVIGAGAWGTALALAATRAGRQTTLWAREQAVADAINGQHENPDYLPGLPLDPSLRATTDALAVLAAADAVLLVVPAQHLRATCATLAPHWRPGVPALICAKGIEQGSGQLMSEVAAETLPATVPLVALSGPSFAAEVARGLPTAVTLACEDQALGTSLLSALGSRSFRPYLSADLIGAEVGGAVKNVLAIACGVLEGRAMGDNARAALLTRGLAEITRLGVAKGGLPGTFMGLSGMGDLLLTATSMQSRNFSLGFALGEGKSLSAILAGRKAVTEGVFTAAAVVALAEQLGVDMPICQAVDAILNRGADVEQVVAALLSRPFRVELEH
ncbi:NAD(P)H-dependent glycerol-3-phosphate dehydrogenase [Insolitispirillum peregrinum]|uniref:Glycerol-3-phosphate dehydrogenase [NAD(P)+] n=1 Tax=Insolitispirillum peregrinum TaxID=80876 RepID=A0A1N7JI78_9PROT|nr:NAD(P)H-dependent glycerol-3-phosphate dehydrogenase [Insolitispirillum peregrinum]SIS48961.1 glycerol-3-phosphate dehydrogenase (NAD(P)+) [Insolitispirillum peregrinum]